MTGNRLRFAQAAECCIGTRFRLHGRDKALGLDCVGLVLQALAQSGQRVSEPAPYALRNLSVERQLPCAEMLGLRLAQGAWEPGDVILFRLRPAQYHLAIVSSAGYLVHAHAGLGRVVVTPPSHEWAMERHWRLAND